MGNRGRNPNMNIGNRGRNPNMNMGMGNRGRNPNMNMGMGNRGRPNPNMMGNGGRPTPNMGRKQQARGRQQNQMKEVNNMFKGLLRGFGINVNATPTQLPKN